MGKMMMLQQSQPSFSLFTSSLSDFNGAKLHLQVQCKRKVNQPKGALYVSASSEKKILIVGGTRFIQAPCQRGTSGYIVHKR
ncbi:BnaC08g50030D [Brassica napus]|uniref:BnaC08g50030D protein n=1 Tax=Brassica napus TaxID=3708 RepID=A0A078JGL2_BRANA|nr:BnaC08g50030D [Brassica napus]